MRILTCLVVLLIATADARPQSLKLTAPPSVQRGSLVPVKVETDCVSLRFILPDFGVSLFDFSDFVDTPPGAKPPKKIALQVAFFDKAGIEPLPDGPYRLYAVGADAKGRQTDPVLLVINVGAAPEPGPNPRPVDPKPNPKPNPSDPFSKSVLDAYAKDAPPADQQMRSRTKAECAAFLASLYRLAANKGGTVDDPSITTRDQLFVKMRNARREQYPDEALLGTRKAIEVELNAALPPEVGAALDREAARAVFLRVAAVLDACK